MTLPGFTAGMDALPLSTAMVPNLKPGTANPKFAQ
jgi:hypothetical protein